VHRNLIVSLLLIIAMAGLGCSYRLGDFTALSSKNVPLDYSSETAATGEACKVTNFLVIPFGPPSLEDAIDDAVGSNGNALINQVTYTSNYTFLLGNYQCFRVKGDVVTLR
jgi:hypothetical protein